MGVRIKEGNYNKFLCHFAENQGLDFRAVGSRVADVISCDECVEAMPAVCYCAWAGCGLVGHASSVIS